MKQIASGLTGLAAGIPKPNEPDGAAHSEIGYRPRARRSSSEDFDSSESFNTPAVRPQPAMPTTKCFVDLPTLPALKPVITGYGPTGTTTGMALANSSDLPLVRSLIATIQEELTPASPREIGAQLVRLFSHYHAQAGVNMDLIAQDWVSDMRDVSAKAFFEAVQTWRRSTNRFRPTPGQLLAIIAELEEPIRKKLATCKQLEAMEG